MINTRAREFHAFLSHSHADADWVRRLALRLEDECGFRVWLDQWRLVPGASWQQAMARGLDQSDSCVVCVGSTTPDGWFQQEIQRALDIQSKDQTFRVIPLLLPEASTDTVSQFLGLRTWVDFRRGRNEEDAFYVLKCGITGEMPNRWPSHSSPAQSNTPLELTERKLQELQRFEKYIREEVVIQIQLDLLKRWSEK